MQGRTHIAIGVFAMFFFLPYVENKLVFIPVVLIASMLPDIDSGFSTMGKRAIFRPIQLFFKHRGALHSLTVCIALSLIFAYFIPVIAFPFFLGYSLHLLADAWTIDGIKPFWPLQEQAKGKVRTGGTTEQLVFFVFIILGILAVLRLFFI